MSSFLIPPPRLSRGQLPNLRMDFKWYKHIVQSHRNTCLFGVHTQNEAFGRMGTTPKRGRCPRLRRAEWVRWKPVWCLHITTNVMCVCRSYRSDRSPALWAFDDEEGVAGPHRYPSVRVTSNWHAAIVVVETRGRTAGRTGDRTTGVAALLKRNFQRDPSTATGDEWVELVWWSMARYKENEKERLMWSRVCNVGNYDDVQVQLDTRQNKKPRRGRRIPWSP